MSDNPLSPDLRAFGATYLPAAPKPGQPWWQLISAEGPMEWGGRVSIYVDVWDEAGHRIVGVPVRQFWNNGEAIKATEPKTGEPFAVDFVMGAGGNAYGVVVADGSPSDMINGLGLSLEPRPHVVYKLIYQRQAGVIVPTPPSKPPKPTPAPGEPLTILQALDKAEEYIQLARGML